MQKVGIDRAGKLSDLFIPAVQRFDARKIQPDDFNSSLSETRERSVAGLLG
jgi:hypothetical protein